MATTTRERLAEFERVMGGVVALVPRSLEQHELELRVRLQLEETAELVAALCGRDDQAEHLARAFVRAAWPLVDDPFEPDLENVAKELADVEYVTHGTAHYSGVDLDLATEIVHESNMAKASGPVRHDGKRLKPEGWTPPDMRPALGEWPSGRCLATERVRRRYREGR